MVSGSVWCGQICQRETRVFKTRVSPFYFFPSSSTRSSSSRAVCFSFFFFVLRRCRSTHPDRASSSVLQRYKSACPNRAKFFGAPHRASSDLLVLPLFFFRSFLVWSSPKSSLRDSILLFRTRVSKTRDLCGNTYPDQQLKFEYLKLDI